MRIGVTFNRTFYFLDKGVQRGIAYEYGQLMEERLNTLLKTGNMKVHVVFVPLPRDMLLSALLEGKVDLVAAQTTVTPERQKVVDFCDPTRTNVNEILVTGPGVPAAASVEDLSGQEVFARKTSSYHQSLLALNEKFKAQGKPPVDDSGRAREPRRRRPARDGERRPDPGRRGRRLSRELLEEGLSEPHRPRQHGRAHRRRASPSPFRKNNPQLPAALNKFMGNYGLGTAFRNQVERQYLVNTTYVKNATSDAERKKFLAVVELFRKYSDQYNLDFLLMAAQGYQESPLNQNARSQVGAIGIMQVMPATGKELKVGDITQIEPNIHAGVKYMRTTMDTYFKDEPMDDLNKALFTFASYNAGPGRVRQLRREAEKRGLNPNVWFGNVEQIASERIGRETVTYVANIYKYYIAYRLDRRRDGAQGGHQGGTEGEGTHESRILNPVPTGT